MDTQKFFQIEFSFSGEGFIRVKADSPEDAEAKARYYVQANGASIDTILDLKEVDSLYPEGYEPNKTLN